MPSYGNTEALEEAAAVASSGAYDSPQEDSAPIESSYTSVESSPEVSEESIDSYGAPASPLVSSYVIDNEASNNYDAPVEISEPIAAQDDNSARLIVIIFLLTIFHSNSAV